MQRPKTSSPYLIFILILKNKKYTTSTFHSTNSTKRTLQQRNKHCYAEAHPHFGPLNNHSSLNLTHAREYIHTLTPPPCDTSAPPIAAASAEPRQTPMPDVVIR